VQTVASRDVDFNPELFFQGKLDPDQLEQGEFTIRVEVDEQIKVATALLVFASSRATEPNKYSEVAAMALTASP